MGGSPYLGKLTKADREFFGARTEGKTINDKDRVKEEENKKPDPWVTRDQLK